VFSLACLALAALAACPAAVQGQWAVETLSTARYLLTAASVRDEVIFTGGVAGSSHFCKVDRYSAATDSRTQECLSAARSWLSAASVSWPAPSKAAFAVFAGGGLWCIGICSQHECAAPRANCSRASASIDRHVCGRNDACRLFFKRS
jgi:hypothetical protein